VYWTGSYGAAFQAFSGFEPLRVLLSSIVHALPDKLDPQKWMKVYDDPQIVIYQRKI
jgi:hypothetical protein